MAQGTSIYINNISETEHREETFVDYTTYDSLTKTTTESKTERLHDGSESQRLEEAETNRFRET